ncbi:MAG: hypothetical protein AAF664_26340, partial [Planctomycetota bacterium]
PEGPTLAWILLNSHCGPPFDLFLKTSFRPLLAYDSMSSMERPGVTQASELQKFRELMQKLPKTDMHLHIEGSISLSEYAEVNEIKAGWEPPGWGLDYRYPNFTVFEEFILGYADQWFNSPERYARSAKSLFERKIAEGVRYLECSFAFIVCEQQELPVDEIVDAIISVVPNGLHVRLFCGLHHTSWSTKTRPALERLIELNALTGIDLHGPELYPVREWMLDYWPAAQDRGKFTKAHAGELGGAWHVTEAVEKLGVRRIEHGFRAIEDDAVVDLLRAENVLLDVCPISNYKLQTVNSYQDHPMIQLLERGISMTINTDDPFIFGNTITDEFDVLARETALSKKTLLQLARNGFEYAILSDEERCVLLAEFDETVEGVALS